MSFIKRAFVKILGRGKKVKKCPNCGYYALWWNEDEQRYECWDCGWLGL